MIETENISQAYLLEFSDFLSEISSKDLSIKWELLHVRRIKQGNRTTIEWKLMLVDKVELGSLKSISTQSCNACQGNVRYAGSHLRR